MKKIHWGRVLVSAANWIVGGGLAAIAPDKYKPAAVALAALIQALIPSIVHTPA